MTLAAYAQLMWTIACFLFMENVGKQRLFTIILPLHPQRGNKLFPELTALQYRQFTLTKKQSSN